MFDVLPFEFDEHRTFNIEHRMLNRRSASLMTAARETSSPDYNGAPNTPGMSDVVHRNIDALMEVRKREELRKSGSDRIADAITAFAGSMWFVYLHAAVFGAW